MLRSVLATILALVSSAGAFQFEGTGIVKVNKTIDIAIQALQEDMNFFVIYHTTTRPCAQCDRYARVLLEFLNKYRGLYKAYHIDCGKMELDDSGARIMMTRCNRSEDHLLPHLDLYVPPKEAYNKFKNNMEIAEEKLYTGPPDIDFLEKFALGWLVNYGKFFISKPELATYLAEDYVAHKALVFVGEKGITHDMKALTAYFKGRLDFAFIDNSVYEVCEEYNIEKFPAMVVISKDLTTGTWSKPRYYQGDWKFFRMRNWLEKYAHKDKRVKPEHSFYSEDRNFEHEIRHLDAEERERRIAEREKQKQTLFEIDSNNFEKQLELNEDKVILVHVYSHKGGRHKEWETVSRKLAGLVKFFEVNPTLEVNKELLEKEFMGLQPPFIVMYPSGDIAKRAKKRRLFSKEAPFSKMAGFLSDLIEDKTDSLNFESLRIHVNRAVFGYKAAVVLFHDRPETLLTYRVIATLPEFEKYFAFANYKNPPDDIVMSTPEQKLPAIVLYYSSFNEDEEVDIAKNPIRMAYYRGNMIYSELHKFFQEFTSSQIVPKTQHQDANVNNLQYQTDLDKCRSNVFCVIGVIDPDGGGNKPGEMMVNQPQQDYMGLLRRLKDIYKSDNIDFWYFDGICHHDLILDFGIDVEAVPTVIVMWWYKKEYAIMDSSYTFENIDLFVKKAKRRGVKIEKLPSDWTMHKRNCAQVDYC